MATLSPTVHHQASDVSPWWQGAFASPPRELIIISLTVVPTLAALTQRPGVVRVLGTANAGVALVPVRPWSTNFRRVVAHLGRWVFELKLAHPQPEEADIHSQSGRCVLNVDPLGDSARDQ